MPMGGNPTIGMTSVQLQWSACRGQVERLDLLRSIDTVFLNIFQSLRAS